MPSRFEVLPRSIVSWLTVSLDWINPLRRCPHGRFIYATALMVTLWISWCGPSFAGQLSDRLAAFPDWQSPPKGAIAKGELIYPDWFEGSWTATSTLREAIAPFAPDLVTPGFEQNKATLNEPVVFTVRFSDERMPVPIKGRQGITGLKPLKPQSGIVADRAFNTKSLGDATVGAGFVQSVELDPNDFSRLTTQFQNGQQLLSESRERAIERHAPEQFMSSEMFLQTFRTASQIYLNQVENTTDYHRITPERIEANQITAIYLSPKDPDFFRARSRPVALYRYDLVLERQSSQPFSRQKGIRQ